MDDFSIFFLFRKIAEINRIDVRSRPVLEIPLKRSSVSVFRANEKEEIEGPARRDEGEKDSAPHRIMRSVYENTVL
jgi:hypothetical protein